MRIATSVAALLAAAALAACSSSSNGSPTTGPSSPAGASTPVGSTSSTGSPTSFPSSTEDSSSPSAGGALTEAKAKAALLSAAEVGGGFASTPPDTTKTALPCTPNDPPLDDQIPPDVNVQADFTGASGSALLTEQIETYADEATITRSISTGEKGLACSSAKLGSTTATIQGPTDLTTQLQGVADKAEGWVVKSSAGNSSLIIAKLGTTLAVFQFTAAPSVDTSALPDVGTIVTAGVAKVAAAQK